MTVSRHPPINEELLSAYLDNEVTDEERSLVEAAIADDPAIAWQVDSLRQTIHLLQELPALVLPRAFTLEAIVADAKRQEPLIVPAPHVGKKSVVAKPTVKEEQTSDWWQWLQQIWQGGNLQLRNAAAVAFTLMLVLFVSNRFVAPYQPIGPQQSMPRLIQVTANTPSSEDVATNSVSARAMAQLETETPSQEPSSTAPTTQPSIAAEAAQEHPVQTASAKQSPVQNETITAGSAAMTLRGSAREPGPDDGDLTGGSPNTARQSDQSESVASSMQDSARTAATESFTPPNSAALSMTTTLRTTVTANYDAENQTTVALTLTPTLPVTLTDRVIIETVTPSVSQSITLSATMEQPAAPEAAGDGIANEATIADNTNHWLGWAQMITALCTVILGGLWWRSRE